MGWRIRSIKNILELSEKEKWSEGKKQKYLEKINHRIQILSLFVSRRNNFVDILTRYVENKIDDLTYINDVLEKKWKKL